MPDNTPRWPRHLPFYYGWIIVVVAFVTMAISVTARTAFSLLMPPLIGEFGWDRGMVAGAFSFGFLISAALSPVVGRLVDRRGPRVVIETGIVAVTAGLFLAPFIHSPLHLYITLGVLVGTGSNLMGFTVQSLYLPNWFVQRRGLAISLAFSGVGAGAITLLPWLQTVIEHDGWRAACRTLGWLVILVLGPLNLFVWRRPRDVGLHPDGVAQTTASRGRMAAAVVDAAWVSTDWTLRRAVRTGRFWWLAMGYFCALFAWYAVQVHQTKYLIEAGFSPRIAAWALGVVSVAGIPGQISLGALSDRIGREWIWSVGCCGFALCYVALLGMEHAPSVNLLYIMVFAQGFLGYALTSVMGPIVIEIFEGAHFGAIFGTINVALVCGGAAGPWVAGLIHDATGSYRAAWLLTIVLCVISATSIWLAAPRKVRMVPGRLRTG